MKINFRTFTTILLFGTLTAVIFGIVFYGMTVFDVNSASFRFISFGFLGSLAFVLLRTQRYFISFVILAALFTGLYVISGKHFLLSHLFYDFSIILSVFIYTLLIFENLKTARYLRPVILAAILSIFFVSNTFMLSLIHSETITAALIFKNMLQGLLIGAGVGMGIEMGDLLVKHENES